MTKAEATNAAGFQRKIACVALVLITVLSLVLFGGVESAAAASLSLKAISVARVGNTGPVTLKLTGTGFTQATTFQLSDSGGAVFSNSKVLVVDDTTAAATFPLAGAAVGDAKVKAILGTESVTLSGALEVVNGLSGKLQVFLDAPGQLNPGQTSSIAVQYANNGGADVSIPLLVLSVPGAKYLGVKETGANLGERAYVLGLPQAPLYTALRPGEAVSIPFYVSVNAAVSAKLFAVSPFDTGLSSVSSGLTGEDKTEFGATVGEFYQKTLSRLEEIVTALPKTKYSMVRNIDGQWLFSQATGGIALPRSTVTGKAYSLPLESRPATPSTLGAVVGDGTSKLWVVIITDEEYQTTALSAWFDPATYTGASSTLSVPSLADATIDGQRVFDLFHDGYGVPASRITWLSDRAGDSVTLSAASIASVFSSLKSSVDGDDRVIVWYSGHAMPPDPSAKYPLGTWLLDNGDVYRAEDLSTALSELNAEASYVFVEAPFSNTFVDSLTSARTGGFAASRSSEQTYNLDSFGGGLFTLTMLKGLAEGASLTEAFADTADLISERGGTEHPGDNAPTSGFTFELDFSPLTTVMLQLLQVAINSINTNSLTALATETSDIATEGAGSSPSYTPGGFAVCPWSRVAYVTDNTNGRLLMINPYRSTDRSIALLTGLGTVGDVDLACGARSLVYSTGKQIREVLFGFTVHIRDVDGNPLANANVTVDTALGQMQKKTDTDGYLTVMGLLDPLLSSREVSLTVESGGKKQLFSFSLNQSCQTFHTLKFTGTGLMGTVDPAVDAFETYLPPQGLCKSPEWVTPDATQKIVEIAINPGLTSVIFQIPGTKRVEQASASTIMIVTPASGPETNVANQVVTGWVSDKSINEVQLVLNGKAITSNVVEGTFVQEITLAPGTNTLLARATSSNGTQVQSEATTVTLNTALTEVKGAVAGCLKDKGTGEPVQGAKVDELTSGQTTTTDSKGCFKFLNLSAKKAAVRVEN